MLMIVPICNVCGDANGFTIQNVADLILINTPIANAFILYLILLPFEEIINNPLFMRENSYPTINRY